MRLVLLGVRGSTPAPGAQFVRYGGHTSCVAVFGEADAVPRLILDAGTGLRALPALLGMRPFDGAIVLTHLHWDHVQGLPFCPSIDRADAHVDLFVPTQRPSSDRGDARRLLAGAMSPPHFPIEPNGLLGQWRFLAAAPGPLTTGVTVAPIAHKGGTTFGIRIEIDGATVAYLPDHALSGRIPLRLRSSAEALAAGVDVLLHDGQFRPGESETAVAYGHSTIDDAMLFADRCRAGALVLIHHAPGRVDAELDDLRDATSETPAGPAGDVRPSGRQAERHHPQRTGGRADQRERRAGGHARTGTGVARGEPSARISLTGPPGIRGRIGTPTRVNPSTEPKTTYLRLC